MSILSDIQIANRVLENEMISPFVNKQIRFNTEAIDKVIKNNYITSDFSEEDIKKEKQVENSKIISYGLSSYGYDARVAEEFKIFTNVHSSVIDPKALDQGSFINKKTAICIIPPNSFALGRTVEYFKIPRDILVLCVGKSTYARCGIVVNVTPLEPEWEGHVTLEFSNTTSLPAKIYAGEGACQFLFFKANTLCKTSYADRQGKYMKQQGITLPII